MKQKFYFVMVVVSWIVSAFSFATTLVFQFVLSIQRFGVIFRDNTIIIPHWSLAFIGSGILFGVIGYLFGRKL